MDAQEPEARENPDKVVARDAFRIFTRSVRTSIAAAGIAVFFFFRSSCGCEPAAPDGIEFKWHGNHCGPGHGNPDDPAEDDLDEACKRHDEAYKKRQK